VKPNLRRRPPDSSQAMVEWEVMILPFIRGRPNSEKKKLTFLRCHGINTGEISPVSNYDARVALVFI